MKPLHPGREGLKRFDCYGQPEHPTKPPGEIWVSLSEDELQLLADAARLLTAQAFDEVDALKRDHAKHGVISDGVGYFDPLAILNRRAAQASLLAGELCQIADSPTTIDDLKKSEY